MSDSLRVCRCIPFVHVFVHAFTTCACVSVCVPVQRAWDELDRWHSALAELEAEVQDMCEEQPEQAQLLNDKLMEPLQLYQDVAKQAEQRTAFLSKVSEISAVVCIMHYFRSYSIFSGCAELTVSHTQC